TKAVLTLSKTDLHATELKLAVDDNGQARELRFVETSFELRVPTAVAPAVFEPEPVLLPAANTGGNGNVKEPVNPSLPLAVSPAAPAASSVLEVEILRQLDQAGALYGEQLSLNRTPQGHLVIQGIVDSAKRKAELRRSIAPFLSNPVVHFEVETAEEAAARQARQSGSSVSVDSVQIEQERAAPADTDLRTYFSSKGLSDRQIDQEVRGFSERALAHSRQARRHALALNQIVERFSSDDLRMMDADSR